MEIDYNYHQSIKPAKELLKSLVMQQSLIETKPSIASIELMPEDYNIKNIYFGTGVSNPKELTKAIPFDILIYPLIAAKIQKHLGECHIHHLIADNHALINNFSKKEIKYVATNYRNIIEDIVRNMGIDNYHTYLSSEVSTDIKYQQLLEQANNSRLVNAYSRYEAADVEYFHLTREVVLKIGWMFKGESNYDESYFDSEYKNIFGSNVYAIYTNSGKRFDDKRPNTVPYTVYNDELNTRIILNKNEDVIKKVTSHNCSIPTIKMLEKHYRGLVRLFEEICYKIPDNIKTIWDKIQFINQFVTM